MLDCVAAFVLGFLCRADLKLDTLGRVQQRQPFGRPWWRVRRRQRTRHAAARWVQRRHFDLGLSPRQPSAVRVGAGVGAGHARGGGVSD